LVRGVWTLPTNVLGHVAGFVASGGKLPRRVGGPAAVGWLYPIKAGIGLDWVGAVTLGHAILYRRGFVEGRELRARLVLAHELAHTRQHDRLGPLYLPFHIAAQAASTLLSFGRPVIISRQHDRNPLEQTFICLGAGATRAPLSNGMDTEEFLAAFGA
jgi:hypothetical protein